MSDPVLGTWAWGRRTGGRLRRRDQLSLVLQAARAQIALSRKAWPAVGPVTPAEFPPDTAFARTAMEVARAASSELLLRHCLRTWLWADLVAQIEHLRHDPELLYAACILHDLGLTPSHSFRTDACFGVEGARAANELATTEGYPRADALADAISLHLNVFVPTDLGAEAHLLHAGAAMDVLGARAGQVPAAARAEVLRRQPRDGFVDGLLALAAQQLARRPRSRIALLQRLGFARLMRRADHAFH
jgi:hypothetical protein